MKPLIFLDIETTGLDKHNDLILEFCIEVRDDIDSKEPLDGYSAIIRPYNDLLPKMDPYVYEMHSRSGLLDALSEGEDLHDALAVAEELFREYEGSMLVGRNVGTFDRPFLEAKRPGICKGLAYRHLDISSFQAFFKLFPAPNGYNPPIAPHDAHRAEVDVRYDLETIRYTRDWLTKIESPFEFGELG